MPRTHLIKTNFSSGEFSPLLEGRVDIEQYGNAVSELSNFIILPYGGVTRRGGWHYIDETKDHTKQSRLIPFQYSSIQSYILEFGDHYIRFYMDGYQIKVITGSNLITNGTFDANIGSWTDKSVAPGAISWEVDHMNLHGGANPGVGWAQQAIATVVGKTYRLQFDVATHTLKVRIGSTDGGQEVLSETEVPIGTLRTVIFIAESVTTYIGFKRDSDGTDADLDNVTCFEWIPYEIESPYLEADLPEIQYAQSAENLYLVHPLIPPQILTRNADNDWAISDMDFIDGPYYDEETTPTITSDWAGPSVEKVTNGKFDTDSGWTKGANWTISGGTANKSAGGLNNLSQDTGEAAVIYYVTYTIKSISGGSLKVQIGGIDGTVRSTPGTYSECITATGTGDLTFIPSVADVVCSIDDVSVLQVATLTASAALWTANHVGALWRIKQGATWGYCEIVKYVTPTGVRAIVYLPIGAVAATSWREGSWCPHSGYPTCLVFHQDRAIFAGTDGQPQTLWASKSGTYNNFTPGTLDAEPYSFTLGSGSVDLIVWLASGKSLMIGTQGGEYVAKGGQDQAITPSNIDVASECTYGSFPLQPIRAGNAVLFLQTAGRKIREFTYDWQSDGYNAPDLTLLSEHLVFDGIKDMAYQQEPYSIVWAVTNPGLLLSLTYLRAQKVVGWAKHSTDGNIESTAVVSNPTLMEDELWGIIKRTVGGSTKRFIERMDFTNYTDSCLTYTGSTPVTKVWGMDHLIGKTVNIVGDSAPYPQAVVAGDGSVTLDGAAAMDIEVGLPFTSKLTTLRPEIVVNGTSQGIAKHWSRIGVRLFETVGVTINGKMVEFRTPDDPMDEGVSLFSGDKWMSNLGRNPDARVTVEQTQPLPITIVCLMGDIDFGD